MGDDSHRAASLKGAAAITGIFACALVVSACASEPERAAIADYETFTREPRDSDVPEAEFDESPLNELEDSYFRQVGRYESTIFYAAVSNQHDAASDEQTGQGLCFIALDSDDGSTSTSCKDPSQLDNPTISLSVQDSSHGTMDAFLVPDQLDIDLPDGWTRTNTNVVIVPDPDTGDQEVTGSLSGRGIWDDQEITLTR